MRRLAFLAAVLLGLAGCAVKEEGRECQGHSDCPGGQACGASGTCTKAAAACGDQGNRPLCRVGVERCSQAGAPEECGADDRGAECASFQVKSTCGAHQVCAVGSSGVAACTCDTSAPCWAAQGSYCDGGSGELVTCAQDGDGCWYEAGRSGCGIVKTCQGTAGSASCACPDPQRCTTASDAFCDPGGIMRCHDVDGCHLEQPAVACDAFQACKSGPPAFCGCVDNGGCAPGVASICNAQQQVVVCQTTNGCNHPAATGNDCPAHQACQAGAGAEGACTCVDDRCAGTVRSFCDAGKLVTCDRTGTCPFENPAADCADPGQTCVETTANPRTAACQCPALGPGVGSACAVENGKSCAGSTVLVCKPKALGSSCLVWTQDVTCATGLSCSGGACVCPEASGGVFFADANSGTLVPPPAGSPTPTGAETPAACRFASIEEALGRANSVPLGGGEVRATGGSLLAPATFVLTGTLALATGVTVTTTDAPLGTGNYTLRAPPALTAGQALITLASGASLSGFHILNDGASGPAIQASCAVGGVDPVLVDTVRISGAGAAANRFSAGLLQASPDCPVTLRNADVQGVGHGVDVTAGALAVEGGAFSGNVRHVHAQPGGVSSLTVSVSDATLTGASDSAVRLLGLGPSSSATLARNRIRSNGFTTTFTVAGGPRGGGGVVFTGPFAGAITFVGNEFRSNKGDQVLVAASAGTLDLLGDRACTASQLINRFGCYDGTAGRGVFSNGATVNVDGNSWLFQPAQTGSDVGGTGVVGFDTFACAPANLPCP